MKELAYVLVTVKGGKAKLAFNEVKRLDNIKRVDAVMGPYDLIVVLEDSDLASIGATVMDKIQMIDGVTKTVTCNVVLKGEE